MPANRYEFRDQWHIPFPIEEVWEVISKSSGYARWWDRAFIKSERLGSVEEPSVGARVEFVVKGWLPYKLRYIAETVSVDPPRQIEFKASGDFVTDGSRCLLRCRIECQACKEA